jgi:Putative transmembrane protein (PGPGW)
MFHKLKQSWQDLQQGEPGRRFQDRWRGKRQGGAGRKVLVIGLGALVFAAGVFFLPAPGPGTVFLVLGAALMAEQSRWIARALDRAELLLRAALRRLRFPR